MTTLRTTHSLALTIALAAVAGPPALAAPPAPPHTGPARGAPTARPRAARVDPGPRDRWTRLSPGIRHLHRTTAEPLSVHAIEVDLQAPGVTVEVTPWKKRWLKTSQFGRATGAVAAVNGGFWSVFDAKPEGLVMHGARTWPGARDDEFYGFFAVTKEGRAEISPAAQVVRRGRGRLREAISGLQRILHRGKVTREAYCGDGCRFRQPRTAVGISADGRWVWLVVVDGRQAHSRGIRLSALAKLFAGLGAAEAINLDGGGSAALYLATAKGLVSQPADRRERDVLNHLGVYWRPSPAELAAWQAAQAAARRPRSTPGARVAARAVTGARPAAGPALAGALDAPPTPSRAGVPSGVARFLQLHWREWLSPRNLLFLLIPLGACGGFFVWRRRRSRPRA